MLRVSEAELRRTAGVNALAAGRAYYRQARVIAFSREGDDIRSRVAGSGRRPYEQVITLRPGERGVHVAATCTCPVGRNCKHVVAALLHAETIARLEEMLAELLAEGRRVIVFSQFTSMLDLIRLRLDAAGIAYALLTGQTRDRPAALAAFQSGAVPVFLISRKAGGTGLSLVEADTVALYNPWRNPAVEAQAIDRAHRIGQTKPVFVHKLVAVGTIEEKMEVLKERKGALAASLFDHDGEPTLAMTEADIEMLLGA